MDRLSFNLFFEESIDKHKIGRRLEIFVKFDRKNFILFFVHKLSTQLKSKKCHQ